MDNRYYLNDYCRGIFKEGKNNIKLQIDLYYI